VNPTSSYGGPIWTIHSFNASYDELNEMLFLADRMRAEHIDLVIDWLDHNTNRFDDAAHVIRYMKVSQDIWPFP
jgi:hypothetical protein